VQKFIQKVIILTICSYYVHLCMYQIIVF